MFRFNSHRAAGSLEAQVEEDDPRPHVAAAAAVPRPSPRNGRDAASQPTGNSPLLTMSTMPSPPTTLPSPLLLSVPSKRTLKQAALAGLPRFFAKEKARVITTNDVVLRSIQTWHIQMPPVKKHVVSGHLVPNITMGARFLFVQHQRDRRITIEIHGPTPATTNAIGSPRHNDDIESSVAQEEEEATATPLKMGRMMASLLEGGTPPVEDQLVLNDNDVVVIRILRTVHHHHGSSIDNHLHSNLSPSNQQHYHPPGSGGGGGGGSTSGHSDDDHHMDDLSTLGPGGPDDDDDHHPHNKHDVEYGSYRLEDVVLLKRHGRTCEMKLGSSSSGNQHGGTATNHHGNHNNTVVIRDLKFESEKQAIYFQESLTRIKTLDQERLHRKADAYRQQLHAASSPAGDARSAPLVAARGVGGGDAQNHDGDMDDTTMIHLLVEIVSATDLPVADTFSTDAYVKVQMGSTDIHRTKVIYHTRSPIWSLETDSLFLLQMTPEEFFAASNGMVLIIKDYDTIGSNTVLGRVVVSHNELLEGKGDRVEYEIVRESSTSTVQQSQYKNDPKDKKKIQSNSSSGHRPGYRKRPKLYLRFKTASQDDIDFMEGYNRNKGKVGVYAQETYLPPRPPEMKLLKRQTKWSAHRGDHHNKNASRDQKELLQRVKPFPDPANEENTKWMTQQEIEDQSIAHSTDWLEVGSGDLGRLFVEVIRCDGLPNMDKGTLNLLDKTDAFCCLLFEDGVVNTDVIGDTHSPRWMPWCRRAFSFRIAHPQSDLIVGVFDYDPPNSPIQIATQSLGSNHDPIGRCVVKLSRLLPQTEYTLTYPLYFGELDEHREKARGTLTLRVRIQYDDKRKTLLAAMKPLPPSLLSCSTKIDYELLDYTSQGADDAKAFSVATFARHIKELQDYQKALPYLTDAVYTVCLWRGHFNIHVFGKTIYLPLHSMVAFTWAILLCRSFDVFPALCVFSIGWIFLGTNECRQRNPSPWNRVFSYGQFWSMLVANRNLKESIDPFQNHDKVKAYEEEIKQREQQKQKERELAIKYEAKLRKMLLDDIEEAEADDVDITTKDGLKDTFAAKLHPLKPVLYPIQLQLGKAVLKLRIVKNVILWAETYFAVWIATFSFVGAAVIFFVPWGLIIGWTIRVSLILATGPWMAIVDHYYFRERPDMTDEDREAEIMRRVQLKYESVTKAASDFQVKKERAIKLRSMKRYLYGKFIVKVPAFNTDKYVDSPLPESFAKPVSSKAAPEIHITGRKYGQVLTGDMIPVREIQAAEIMTKTNNVHEQGTSILRHVKSAIGFVGQQPGRAIHFVGQQPRNAMNAMKLVGSRPEHHQQLQHERTPLLSNFTRPFQNGDHAVVSPRMTTSTILEEDAHAESSEHSATGNNNNNNTTTTTLETKVGMWSTTTQNLSMPMLHK